MVCVRAFFLLIICAATARMTAETISTAQIVHRTTQGIDQCLDWKWVGNCFWLQCDLLGCSPTTSMKVRHYLPDLLVTVQQTPSSNPWLEMRSLLRATQEVALASLLSSAGAYAFEAGSGEASTSYGFARNGDLRFFESNVFGHPMAELPPLLDKLLCESVTRPAKPYFQSTLDAVAWRFAPTESMSPNALMPGRREIGSSGFASWGGVYPRSGFIIQQSPARAAAVVAQRACDIVLGSRGTHVALALDYTMPPAVLNERDPNTGVWQMISPKVDSSCALFGSSDPAWDYGRIDESRAFIWNLWRPYECCEPNGDIFLGDIDF